MHSLTTILCVLVHWAHAARVPRKAERLAAALSTNPERWITYGFRPSGITPTLIDATKPLFDHKYADKISYATLTGETRSSENIHETARKVATESGLEVDFLGIFSAAVKISTEHMNNNKVRKFRMDRKMVAQQYKLTLTEPYPGKMLTETALDFLRKESPERIVEQYGEFYARELRLGGIFQLTNVAEMSSSDTKESVAWDIRAGFSFGLSVSLFTKGNVSKSEYKKNTQISTKWDVQGGRTTIWFGLKSDDSNLDEIQKQWADSLTDDNLFPVQTRLVPLWKVLDDVDPTKARQLETYLKAKWEEEDRNVDDGSYQPQPDLNLYCVGHGKENWFAYLNTGRYLPDWAPHDRFCFQTFPENKGPEGTITYCQGRNNDWYTHLVVGRTLPDWAWRERFCFDAFPHNPEGTTHAGMEIVCNGWDWESWCSYLSRGGGLPGWAGRGHFCFQAYGEHY